MRARSYIEQFKAILEGGVGVLKVVEDRRAGKVKKRPRILTLAGSGKGEHRALALHRPRTAREHGKFRSWRGGAWWERVAASGAGARGSRAVASYVARGVLSTKSLIKRGAKKMTLSLGGDRKRLRHRAEPPPAPGDAAGLAAARATRSGASWSIRLTELCEVVEERVGGDNDDILMDGTGLVVKRRRKKKTMRLILVSSDARKPPTVLECLTLHVHSYLLAGLTLVVLESQNTTPKAGSWTVPDVPPELKPQLAHAAPTVAPLAGRELERFSRALVSGVRLRKHAAGFGANLTPPRRRVVFSDVACAWLGWRRIDGLADPRKRLPFSGLRSVAGPGAGKGRPHSFSLLFAGDMEVCLEAYNDEDAAFYVAGFLALARRNAAAAAAPPAAPPVFFSQEPAPPPPEPAHRAPEEPAPPPPPEEPVFYAEEKSEEPPEEPVDDPPAKLAASRIEGSAVAL